MWLLGFLLDELLVALFAEHDSRPEDSADPAVPHDEEALRQRRLRQRLNPTGWGF